MCSAPSTDKLTVSDIVQNCTLCQQLTFLYLHISSTMNVATDDNILPSYSKVIQHCLILLDMALNTWLAHSQLAYASVCFWAET